VPERKLRYAHSIDGPPCPKLVDGLHHMAEVPGLRSLPPVILPLGDQDFIVPKDLKS
jgi:hypothetical protein